MNRMRNLRMAAGMQLDDVAEKLNVTRTTVSRYELEKRQLDPATICALCDLFGCTADYLLGRSDAPLPAVSDADARILDAYHAASVRDRGLIDQILAAYMPDSQSKIAPSSAS